ncbi:MAG: type II secretion system secretin GspD [Pseudomonadota bacterium]
MMFSPRGAVLAATGFVVLLGMAAFMPGHLEAARMTPAPEVPAAEGAGPMNPADAASGMALGLPSGLPNGGDPGGMNSGMGQRMVTMDFREVDIKELIKTISELTGRNFIIDSRVKGAVTIISPRQITLNEAYRVFLSVLEINGFTTVQAGAVLKIMPTRDAGGRAVETGRSEAFAHCAGEDKVVTQLIPLKYADCDDLATRLKPMVSREAIIVPYQLTNTLIVTDLLSSIERLLKVIHEVDVEGMKEKLTVIPLRHAAARTLAEELTGVLGGGDRSGLRPRAVGMNQGQGTVFKVTADERTNSLIIVADLPKTQEVLALVEKLDVETPTGTDRVHVYSLQNAVAEDLAKVLTGVIQDKTSKSAGGGAPPGAAPVSDNVTISADKATNSLVITAAPSDYAVLESIIAKLDIMRAQVLIEAFIAELSFSKTRSLGSSFLLSDVKQGDLKGQTSPTSFGGFNTGTMGALLANPATAAGGTVIGILKGIVGGATDAKGNKTGAITAGTLIQALESDADTNILSTPTLLTMDNEEAEIFVGEQRPFLKSDLSSVVSSSDTSVSKTYEYKDVGLRMKITPHVTSNKFVRMKVFQEIKGVLKVEGTPESGAISTTNRSANTTVVVRDGETIVIGGLIQETRDNVTSKTPCLGNIPVLGWAFKTTSKEKHKTNLIVLITPHIVTSPEDIRNLTDLKREEMNDITRQFHEESQQAIKRNLELLLQ